MFGLSFGKESPAKKTSIKTNLEMNSKLVFEYDLLFYMKYDIIR